MSFNYRQSHTSCERPEHSAEHSLERSVLYVTVCIHKFVLLANTPNLRSSEFGQK